MDLCLEAVTEEAEREERPAKVRAVSARQSSKGDEAILEVLAKLSLSSAQGVRALRAATMLSIRLPAECKWVQEHLAATNNFAKASAALRDSGKSQEVVKEKLGAPHLHGFNALLKVLVEKVKGKDEETMVSSFIASLKGKGWQELAKMVTHSVMAKCYDAHWKRYEVRVEPVSQDFVRVWDVLLAYMMKEKGAAELIGQAPRGDLERRAQEWLESRGTRRSD